MGFHLLYVAAFQVSLFLFLVLSINYFFRGKNFELLKKSFVIQFLLCLYVGIFINIIFILKLTNMLLFLIILLGICLIYLNLLYTSILYLLIVMCQFIVFDQFYSIPLYASYLIIAYITTKLIKTRNNQFTSIYILSLLTLNVELFINLSPLHIFLAANLLGITAWYLLIVNILFLKNRNIELIQYQENTYIDQATNVKNYNCIIRDSEGILKDKGTDISIILINVDKLKDVNILYGVTFGDKVIKIVAEGIKDIIYDYGELYRLDGDTFCVVIKNEKISTLEIMTEKIRLDVNIKDLIIDNNKIAISVSIGAYYGKVFSKNIDDYIELAHASLLESKFTGNRVKINCK